LAFHTRSRPVRRRDTAVRDDLMRRNPPIMTLAAPKVADHDVNFMIDAA
jgi:hypothetical protein